MNRTLLYTIAPIIAAIVIVMMPLSAHPQEQNDVNESILLQRKIDSILATITPFTNDSTKAYIYHEIARLTEYGDSAIKYAKLSIQYCPPNDKTLLARNYCNIGWGYSCKSIYDSSYIYTQKSIQTSKESGDSSGLTASYLAMAKFFENRSNNDSALHYAHNALDMSIRTKDTLLMTYCYQRLGNLSYDKRYLQSAEEYYRLALYLNKKLNNPAGMAENMQWLGDIYLLYYDSEHDTSCLYTAKDYFTQVLSLIDSSMLDNINNTICKYDTYSDMAEAYIKLASGTGNDKYADSCLAYYNIAEKFFIQHGDNAATVNISRSYVQYLMFKGRYKEAEKYLLDTEKYFDSNTMLPSAMQAHHLMLKEVYVKLGNWKKAFLHSEQEHKYFTRNLNDSTMAATADSKTEQALIIERIKQENAERIHAEQQSRMTTINIALLIGLILTIALAFSIHRAFKNKKRSNNELLVKNQLLNSQKSEIEAQRDEIEHQRDIISQQWKEVDTANQKLLYSINYARQIQTAVIPSQTDIDAIFSNNFVYYRPKNIVSGDFYSAVRCGRYSVMITADCTGHGIPGALLSMLGISALKENLTSEADAEQPSTVLNRIRDFVKATLNTDNDAITSDGMDMTICCIDRQSMTMKYAIANQTAIIIHDGEAIRLKGDAMPLGRFLTKDRSFNTYSLPIAHGDMLYMFTDGIQDQIGFDEFGEQQRFNSIRLLSTINDIHALPVPEQLATFSKTITTWQGALPQIDDMTLVGIRID